MKAERGATWGIRLLLGAALLLRVILVLRGGQFGQIDEDRYLDSRAAAAEILAGHLRQGLALAVDKGDHVGFKVLGIIPALLEHSVGNRPWIPGLFFASFSILAIALLGVLARRLSGSRRAQFWAVLGGACSGALFYFSRHLLPYDAALTFILGSLCLSLTKDFGWPRFLFAGLLAGAGFTVYYGYWTLAGLALGLGTVWGPVLAAQSESKDLLRRAAALALGFAVVPAALVAVDKAWGSGHLIAGARGLSGSITTGDFRGHWVPIEYLWLTDRLELPVTLILTAVGCGFAYRRTPARSFFNRLRQPEILNAAALLGVWLNFVLTGTLLHKFAVHDRLIRQLLPFLVLGFALGMDAWQGHANPARRRWAQGIGAVLVLNAAFCFSIPLTQEFPRDFEVRGEALLRALHPAPSPDYYYRYVNVTQYFLEPEVLRVQPLETLLAAPHPFDYHPYLYEAKTPKDRAHREAIDHRMRLVKMPVLESAQIRGDPYGLVTMQVRLPLGRGGYFEPLLSMGARTDGDLFFIHYLSDSSIAIGYFCSGDRVLEGSPITVAPGSEHQVTLFCGDLAPPVGNANADERNHVVFASIDRQTVLIGAAAPKPCMPGEVYAGALSLLVDYTFAEFSGDILDVRRTEQLDLLPKPRSFAIGSGVRDIRLTIILGPSVVGAVEPLVEIGRPGQAAIVYIRTMPAGQVRIGCDVWGVGAWESPLLAKSFPGSDFLECELGPLFPPPGSSEWKSVPVSRQTALRDSVVLRWNGHKVLDHSMPFWAMDARVFRVGFNYVGGSVVGEAFSGKVLKVETPELPTPETVQPPPVKK